MTEAHKLAGFHPQVKELFNLPDYRDAVTAAVLASAPDGCIVTVHSSPDFPWWVEVKFRDGSIISVYDAPWGISGMVSSPGDRRIAQGRIELEGGQISYVDCLVDPDEEESMPAKTWLEMRKKGLIAISGMRIESNKQTGC